MPSIDPLILSIVFRLKVGGNQITVCSSPALTEISAVRHVSLQPSASLVSNSSKRRV